MSMDRDIIAAGWRALRSLARVACLAVVLLAAGGPRAAAQESNAPMAPPPEHDVRRMGTTPEPAAPPALPPEVIIQKFSEKEDKYLAELPTYGYRKTLRIDEFDHQGKVVGQFLMVTDAIRGSNGQVVNKVVQHPQSTLHYFSLEPEDVKALDRIPPFPLTSSQLTKYNLKYIGDEQIDEIECYIFQVKPKGVERLHAYFDGIVWVDAKYLEVVKTYGKWVNELGDVHIQTLPFTMFETYRENVDGKYWFPNYERSDDTIHLKEGDVPLRLVIKWTDFKTLPATVTSTPPPPDKAGDDAPTKPEADTPAKPQS
jgi:hypothetical protein